MGVLVSWISQSFPPPSNFTPEHIPDLSGKVIIVTGANVGVGKETAKELLAHNAKVYIASRSQQKAEEAIADLKQITGKEAFFLKLDLADLKSVKAAAEEFLSKEDKLHVLYNNGGVMAPPIEQTSADGYDLTFGTNVVGHFYFTKLLLPTLISTAKAEPDSHARIVNIASSSHLMISGLDFSTFKDGPARRRKSPNYLYSQSKFGNIVLAAELARRYGDQGIVATAVNPGNIKTDVLRNTTGPYAWFLNTIMYNVSYGVLTQLWAGVAPEAAAFNGLYLIPWARVGAASQATQDPTTGQELWTWLEEQVKDV